MVSTNICPNPVGWSISGDRNTASTTMMIFFFKAPTTAVYLRKSAWFYRNVFSSERLFLSHSHALWIVARIVRRHKCESCLCIVLLGCHCQHEVSVPASYEVQHHGIRIPTNQLMYIDFSFSCFFSSDI